MDEEVIRGERNSHSYHEQPKPIGYASAFDIHPRGVNQAGKTKYHNEDLYSGGHRKFYRYSYLK